MVGSIRYRRTDPNRKGRGAGLYYHRGNGVWSKYSARRDRRKRASTRITRKQGGTIKRPGHWAHIGDKRKYF